MYIAAWGYHCAAILNSTLTARIFGTVPIIALPTFITLSHFKLLVSAIVTAVNTAAAFVTICVWFDLFDLIAIASAALYICHVLRLLLPVHIAC